MLSTLLGTEEATFYWKGRDISQWLKQSMRTIENAQDIMRACGRKISSQLGDEGVRIRRDDTCLGFLFVCLFVCLIFIVIQLQLYDFSPHPSSGF